MNLKNNDTTGYIYILKSPNCDCVKIGGTDYPPIKRIKEINSTEPYKTYDIWPLADFRQVADWRKVEHNLHYKFRSKLNTEIESQKELFHISPLEASTALNEIDETKILYKPKVDRMFQDNNFMDYLLRLFSYTGLNHWIDIQGVWTFVLFPSTNGGRYFTINIGNHEVAFSTLPKKCSPQINMILVDKLILDFPEIRCWVDEHNGAIELDSYKTALPRSASVFFCGDLEVVIEFLKLDGVRRALIAYWNEALITISEQDKLSTYARYHNYNAVAKIVEELWKKINFTRDVICHP